MVATTLEQSKKLVELGIDPNTADMYYWCKDEYDLRIGSYKARDEDLDIPAWSVSALLELMPKHENVDWSLSFGAWKEDEYVEEWCCEYENLDEPFTFFNTYSVSLIDVVFKMIVELKENGQI